MLDIVCILDRSGSMASSIYDVIGGFNAFLKEQKKESPSARVTMTIFDNEIDFLYEKEEIGSVEKLVGSVFYARGSTALNDAIGLAVGKIGKNKKRVICLIHTDGMENASREFTTDDIKALVEKKQGKGWKFIFAGTSMDKFTRSGLLGYAGTIGIARCDTHIATSTSDDISSTYATLSSSSTDYSKQTTNKSKQNK